MRGVLKRIAVIKGKVAVFTDFDRTHTVVNVQYPGRFDCNSAQRLLKTQTVRRRVAGLEENDSRFWDIGLVPTLQRYWNTGVDR